MPAVDAVHDPELIPAEIGEDGELRDVVMSDVIVNSDLAGHESHGMRRLAEYVQRWRDGKVVADAQPTIELDTGAVARLDGGNGFGQLVMRDATDLAVARAKEWGVAALAVRRSGHAGRYADFCERAADLGVAIMFFVNDAGAGQRRAARRSLSQTCHEPDCLRHSAGSSSTSRARHVDKRRCRRSSRRMAGPRRTDPGRLGERDRRAPTGRWLQRLWPRAHTTTKGCW